MRKGKPQYHWNRFNNNFEHQEPIRIHRAFKATGYETERRHPPLLCMLVIVITIFIIIGRTGLYSHDLCDENEHFNQGH